LRKLRLERLRDFFLKVTQQVSVEARIQTHCETSNPASGKGEDRETGLYVVIETYSIWLLETGHDWTRLDTPPKQ
jgi:hypothetical protein